jgi:hypothetical protein
MSSGFRLNFVSFFQMTGWSVPTTSTRRAHCMRCGYSAPAGELGGQGTDAAEHPMHEQRLTADWPVTEDGAVGGDTGNAQSRSNVVAEFVWRRHRQAFGDHGELGGGTEGPVGLRTADPHPLSDTALVDCVAHLVDDTRGARMR